MNAEPICRRGLSPRPVAGCFFPGHVADSRGRSVAGALEVCGCPGAWGKDTITLKAADTKMGDDVSYRLRGKHLVLFSVLLHLFLSF